MSEADLDPRGARATRWRAVGMACVVSCLVALVAFAFWPRDEHWTPPPRDMGGVPSEGYTAPILVGHAPATKPVPPVPAAQVGELRGEVVEKETVKPVQGALLYLLGEGASDRVDGAPFASTDEHGRFVLPRQRHAASGDRMFVHADGFLAAVLDLPAVPSDSLRVELERGMGVSGRVLDLEGRPVAHASVSALGATAYGRSRFLRTFRVPVGDAPNVATSETNASGEFSLSGLRDERVRLRVSRRGWKMANLRVAPPRSSRDEAMPLLAATTPIIATGTRDVELRMQPVWALSYVAIDDATSDPLAHFMVRYSATPSVKQRWNLADGDDGDWFTGDEPHFRAKRAYFTRDEAAPASTEEIQLRVDSLGYERADVTLVPRHPEDPLYLQPERVRLKALSRIGTLKLTVSLKGEPVREPLVMQVVEQARKVWANVILADRHPDGGHRIALPEGSYRCTILGTPGFQTLDAVPQDLTVRSDEVTDVTYALTAGVAIINVHDSAGRGLDGARVRVTYNDAFARSWFLQKPDSMLLKNANWTDQLGPAGRGTFQLFLRPGSYKVQVGSVGFRDQSIENMVVHPDVQTTLDVVLDGEK